MKIRLRRILGFSFALVLIGQNAASADFEGPFAPSNWTFSGDAAANSLSSSQMQITSYNTANNADPLYGLNSSASYSISVSSLISTISFSYSYSTNDVNGSGYDMAKFSIAGVSTDLVATNPNQGYSETGTVYLSGIDGKSFAIVQQARDSVLGSATITITNFQAHYKNLNQLVAESTPKLSQSGNILTCSPGTYSFLNGGGTKQAANLSSVTYTLEVDGLEASRVVAGKSSLPSMLSELKNSFATSATLAGATFDISGKTNFEASCKVMVTQGSTVLSTSSETIADIAKKADIEAKAQAWEDQRSTATAANFTKEAREARKRAAARAVNG